MYGYNRARNSQFRNRGFSMQIRPPFMVSYSITTKCNLKCKHCYSELIDQAAPDELSTEEAFQLMDDLSKWGIGLLVIDGGEPLCREDMLDIVEYASSKGIRTTIGSNGTLIDDAMARKLLVRNTVNGTNVCGKIFSNSHQKVTKQAFISFTPYNML